MDAELHGEVGHRSDGRIEGVARIDIMGHAFFETRLNPLQVGQKAVSSATSFSNRF